MPEIADILKDAFATDRERFFDDAPDVSVMDPPEVGIAAADDPWFVRFKNDVIGSFYFLPTEILNIEHPGLSARSVICWFLPVAERARCANRVEKWAAAREWAYVRGFGEDLNDRLRAKMAAWLRTRGFVATAPCLLDENSVERRDGVGLSSRWSERHAAFVAGLGTFGISGGLITRRGVAGRFGSVVTDMPLEPTPRAYGDDPFAWCLRMSRGSCGACINRCPSRSIGETVHQRDKDRCQAHNRAVSTAYRGTRYNWEGVYGCGLCQTGVPCESRNPCA